MWWRRRNHECAEAVKALEANRQALEEAQGRSHEVETLSAWLHRARTANHVSERVEAMLKASYGRGDYR
jgi:hypothetical protein